ncbi:hypothetical protein E2C01_030059 [Portunus trituberculatus]|uniref:Uncharacterized protein n=1 Tax=Portunus trituberculatus TaxID=210409 RepID=A0A5B7ETW7_PORTR|nr:hypothetical protein [Portunus trituberculatus]
MQEARSCEHCKIGSSDTVMLAPIGPVYYACPGYPSRSPPHTEEWLT